MKCMFEWARSAPYVRRNKQNRFGWLDAFFTIYLHFTCNRNSILRDNVINSSSTTNQYNKAKLIWPMSTHRHMTFPRSFPILRRRNSITTIGRQSVEQRRWQIENNFIPDPDNGRYNSMYLAIALSLFSSRTYVQHRPEQLNATFENDFFLTCYIRRCGVLLLFNTEFSVLEWSWCARTNTKAIPGQFSQIVNLFAQLHLRVGRYLSVIHFHFSQKMNPHYCFFFAFCWQKVSWQSAVRWHLHVSATGTIDIGHEIGERHIRIEIQALSSKQHQCN